MRRLSASIRTTAYEQLKVVSKSLLDRMIRREEPTKRGLKVHLDHWVSGITYHEGEAWIELRFSHEATPYLTNAARQSHHLLTQASRWPPFDLLMAAP